MNRQQLFKYIQQKYSTTPEYPWKGSELDGVFRHTTNNKWYGLIMNISKEKIAIEGTEKIDILNVKCSPELIGSLRLKHGYLPAYHMNKEHWITIVLEEVENEKIKQLIEISYELTEK